MTNSDKIVSTITGSNKCITVNKLKVDRFQIDDYIVYNKEKDFYYNLSYAQIKNLYWNSDLIVGYVASDEINNNNGNKNKSSMIEFSRSD